MSEKNFQRPPGKKGTDTAITIDRSFETPLYPGGTQPQQPPPETPPNGNN